MRTVLALLASIAAGCGSGGHKPAGSPQPAAGAEQESVADPAGCQPRAADAVEARIVLQEAVPASEPDPAITCPAGTALAERLIGIGNSDLAEVMQRFCQRPDGIRQGPFVARFATAILEQGWYQDGARHGPWEFQDTSGAPTASGMFSRGHRHGTWISRHPNGAMAWQGGFECGERSGSFVWWTPDGSELQRRTF
ncbi:MAG TPA: hypothetical protein VML75_24865 [Kofleriaceae bacterium]|nr:hypothetical protein [Kofleriaceae bacterium]